jgi:acetyltransferase-like isoleucine patch superfamily enzyme
MGKISQYLYAKYRAFAPVSCFESPRADILRGWRRWRWLTRQRRAGRLIEPSVRFQGDVQRLDDCLIMGKQVWLERGCIVWMENNHNGQSSRIELDDRVYIGPYSFIGTAGHRLRIGQDSMIGAHCYITTENHRTERKDLPYAQQGYVGADVVIGKNVWLGCHVTVLPGVTIGDNAIIGAGAVVTKNIPAGETWGGVPAKPLH